ncbi:M48 family metallopeptidase [Desulfolutivibrio sp.]|uniref:M48 family metallopeptidase n=1 Tax=Desulfolutivibrio sp. TaxID=2773296 RepID=UPI002F962C36
MATSAPGRGLGAKKNVVATATAQQTAAASRLAAAMLDVPVPVCVRSSRRAGGVILRMLPGRGLEIVVPAGFRLELLPLAVESRRTWIEDAAARLAASGELPGLLPVLLPRRIPLTALGLEYRVDYLTREAPGRGCRVREMGAGRLAVSLAAPLAGPLAGRETGGESLESARQALCAFVRAKAAPLLVSALRQASLETGLPFVSARVRQQRTRWGSCTAGGRVSLNVNLAFLPAVLARYVFIHELCHTRHQDHSPRFWNAVRAIEPGCRELDAALRHGAHYVPLWFSRGITGPSS